MAQLSEVAPSFVEVAHRIVWATAASVDAADRPRTRILHPIWEWDGTTLRGWIATGPTPVKRADLEHSPHLALSYWDPSHDTCSADCQVTWLTSDEDKAAVWDRFARGPAPVGYDPSIIPGWEEPSSPGFAALELHPYRLRVFPGSVLLGRGGEVRSWVAPG